MKFNYHLIILILKYFTNKHNKMTEIFPFVSVKTCGCEFKILSRVEGKMSRVEGKMSRVESKMSRVEGKMSRVEGKMSRVQFFA